MQAVSILRDDRLFTKLVARRQLFDYCDARTERKRAVWTKHRARRTPRGPAPCCHIQEDASARTPLVEYRRCWTWTWPERSSSATCIETYNHTSKTVRRNLPSIDTRETYLYSTQCTARCVLAMCVCVCVCCLSVRPSVRNVDPAA